VTPTATYSYGYHYCYLCRHKSDRYGTEHQTFMSNNAIKLDNLNIKGEYICNYAMNQRQSMGWKATLSSRSRDSVGRSLPSKFLVVDASTRPSCSTHSSKWHKDLLINSRTLVHLSCDFYDWLPRLQRHPEALELKLSKTYCLPPEALIKLHAGNRDLPCDTRTQCGHIQVLGI
jgi:hypothetical protein